MNRRSASEGYTGYRSVGRGAGKLWVSYTSKVKSQAELREDFQRYMAEDKLDEAEAVLELLEPLSDDEWIAWHENAPVDNEPLSPKMLARLAALDEKESALGRTGTS